jgi:hypothetical protein
MSYLSASAASLGCSCQEHPAPARAQGALGDTVIGLVMGAAKAAELRAEVNRFPGVKVATWGSLDLPLAMAALDIMAQRLADSRIAYPTDRGLNSLIYNLEQARLPANAVAYVDRNFNEVLATVRDIGNTKRLPVATLPGKPPSTGSSAKVALAAAAGLGLLFFLRSA